MDITPNYNYSMAKMYPNEEIRNKLVSLGIPRWRHNLAELGELLPNQINVGGEIMRLLLYKKKIKYESYQLIHSCMHHVPFKTLKETDDTEANTRGKMLIYLLENKLMGGCDE